MKGATEREALEALAVLDKEVESSDEEEAAGALFRPVEDLRY